MAKGKWWRQSRRWGWIIIPAAVAYFAFAHRDALLTAVNLMGQADLRWLVPAALAIGGVYLCRAAVYRVPLIILGYTFTRRFLWGTALVATSLHQLVPTAGASGYAFLTYALHQRGVATGQASLIALIDTLCYAVAVATLVVGALVYLAISGTLDVRAMAFAFAPGILLVAIAAWLWHLQHDQRTFVPRALRLQRRLASLVGAHWSEEPLRKFLREYYEGKRLIRARRSAFLRMVGFQYLSTCCDAAALYMAFLALGLHPKVWLVFMGFVLSMAGLAVLSAPGGGGSFETIMAAFFARHGFDPAQGLAAAVIYRIVAFWLPVLASGIVLLRLRRRRKEIRRVAEAEQRRRRAG